MATTQRTTVVGVLEDRRKAQQAVDELKRAGFREDQIGVVSRDGDASAGATATTETGSKMEEGAVTGVAAGAGIGALWALGIAAGVLPGIGPVIAGGVLASVVASAVGGAAVAGLVGALIGLGIPEEEARYYEGEFQAGRTIVTVKAEGRYDEAVAILRRYGAYDVDTRRSTAASGVAGVASTRGEGEKTVQVREEELHARKQPVETGEVRVGKEVHTEHRTLEVPVQREEVVIERRPVSGHQPAGSDIQAGEEIRIPVKEEQVHVEKQPVVKEEVTVGKRQVQETEQVTGTVKKEEVRVEREGDVDVRSSGVASQDPDKGANR